MNKEAPQEKAKRKINLSNEFIERMIRLEQKLSANFGKGVLYNETECYKNLSDKEKLSFRKYLKTKPIRKLVTYSSFFVFLFILFVFHPQITGGVVSETFGRAYPLVLWVFLILGFGTVGFLIYKEIYRKSMKKRFEKHLDVLDSIQFKKLKSKPILS